MSNCHILQSIYIYILLLMIKPLCVFENILPAKIMKISSNLRQFENVPEQNLFYKKVDREQPLSSYCCLQIFEIPVFHTSNIFLGPMNKSGQKYCDYSICCGHLGFFHYQWTIKRKCLCVQTFTLHNSVYQMVKSHLHDVRWKYQLHQG